MKCLWCYRRARKGIVVEGLSVAPACGTCSRRLVTRYGVETTDKVMSRLGISTFGRAQRTKAAA